MPAPWKLQHDLANSSLHMVGKCGHGTMIERVARFQLLVSRFLSPTP
jgi:hypothetical protein